MVLAIAVAGRWSEESLAGPDLGSDMAEGSMDLRVVSRC